MVAVTGVRMVSIKMRCPFCGGDNDKVIDSRVAEEGEAIRRRRECVGCGERFTTFERVEEKPLVVVKRNGQKQEFSLEKILAGIRKACKNRPIDELTIQALAGEIEEAIRSRSGVETTSREIGSEILDRLAELDEVAYMRFASVYLRFDGLTDFAREVGRLRAHQPASNK